MDELQLMSYMSLIEKPIDVSLGHKIQKDGFSNFSIEAKEIITSRRLFLLEATNITEITPTFFNWVIRIEYHFSILFEERSEDLSYPYDFWKWASLKALENVSNRIASDSNEEVLFKAIDSNEEVLFKTIKFRVGHQQENKMFTLSNYKVLVGRQQENKMFTLNNYKVLEETNFFCTAKNNTII